MRAVHLADVMAAAQVLVTVPGSERVELRDRMLREAEIADRFTRRLGRLHPRWGNGTLKDVARRRAAGVASRLDDPVYCEAMILVLLGIQRRPRAVHL